MEVAVLGGGVVGLCSAYQLAREGHRVTVLEARGEVGLGASHANGGQLSYSYVAPLAGPGVLPHLPGWLLRRDAPMRFSPRLDPVQWAWGLRFLAACTAARSDATTRRLLRLSFLSRDLLHRLVGEERLEFGFARSGKLVVHSDARDFAAARGQLARQRELGCVQEALDADGCLAAEPALAALRPRLVGGILTRDEEAGDCFRFCRELARVLTAGNLGVRLRLGTAVRQLLRVGGRVVGAVTDAGVVEADAYVLCAGVASVALVRPLGVALPIYPLRGYSLSLPLADAAAPGAPRLSVTDAANKVVYARLGPVLRVAGMADLVGHDAAFDPARLALLARQARAAFPEAADWTRLGPWCGARPTTPTGLPILGPLPGAANLHLNVGHGALGFTLAMGAAAVVAAGVAGRAAPIELEGFRPAGP